MAVIEGTRIEQLGALVAPVAQFLTASKYAREPDREKVADFVAGNPHDMPLAGFVDAIEEQLEPHNPQWFAYTMSNPRAQATIADSLRTNTGVEWEPDDVVMTTGSFGALAVTLRTICSPGDEVVYLSPPWFFYELMIASNGATPVRVNLQPPRFELDTAAIASAITPRTRAVILNSPHNPSGRVYELDELRPLAELLNDRSQATERPIQIVSDESYRRILFDGRTFHSPAELYPETFVCYTYGKQLLTPGERIGYVATPAAMAERERWRKAFVIGQIAGGWGFPNATLQRAIPALEKLSIDVGAIQRRRDRIVPVLARLGLDPITPEGTFYALARTPIEDDVAWAERLGEQEDVWVLPGTIFELPGWFRISLTATDSMVERARPALERFVGS